MNGYIHCLMVGGGSLTDEIRSALVEAAHDMMDAKGRKAKLTLREHGVVGNMKTDYAYGMVGMIGGYEFAAEFCHEGRDIKARFIVTPLKRHKKLPKGIWLGPKESKGLNSGGNPRWN